MRVPNATPLGLSDASATVQSALDRITIPQAVLDRFAPTALPRSSIIISDEPLNRETNYRTEFVVVLNDQPQGGLAMRRPAEVPVARGWDSRYGEPRWRGAQSYDPRQYSGYYYYQRQNGPYYYRRQQGWW